MALEIVGGCGGFTVSSLQGYVWGGGAVEGTGRDSSLWWMMVSVIRGGAGMGVGSWFDENMRRVVGGGGNTYFWTDNWVNDAPLWM